MIKSSVIENLVYSKKMLFRVKELNERMQNCSSKSNTLETENIHAIRHFNDKWKYQKDKTKIERPAKTREVSTARSPFKRLLKYPSVQRYLGMESMQ
jgi:ADP-dependent phosphofructokinase/glucokinase